jgi:hypothetical protein
MSTTMSARSGDRRPVGRPFRRARRWWRDASVRRKLVMTTAVGMLACLPPTALAIVLELRVADLRATTRSTEILAKDVQSLQGHRIAADAAMRYYAIQAFDDPQYVADYEAATGRIPPLIAGLERDLPADLDDEMQDTVSSIDAQLVVLDAIINYQLATPALDNPTDQDVATRREPSLLERLLASTSTLQDSRRSIATLAAGLDERLRTERHDIEQLEQGLARSVLVGWVLALGAVVGGIAAVTGGIVRRIERLSENGQRFLRGEPLLPSPAPPTRSGSSPTASKSSVSSSTNAEPRRLRPPAPGTSSSRASATSCAPRSPGSSGSPRSSRTKTSSPNTIAAPNASPTPASTCSA